RQSWEGSSERVRAMSEFQKDQRDRTQAFALGSCACFPRSRKRRRRRCLGSNCSGLELQSAHYREAFRARSKADFIAKCGDSLREIEESAYWLELLVESGVVTVEKFAPLRQECEELTAIFVTVLKRAKTSSFSRHPSSFRAWSAIAISCAIRSRRGSDGLAAILGS